MVHRTRYEGNRRKLPEGQCLRSNVTFREIYLLGIGVERKVVGDSEDRQVNVAYTIDVSRQVQVLSNQVDFTLSTHNDMMVASVYDVVGVMSAIRGAGLSLSPTNAECCSEIFPLTSQASDAYNI